MVIITNTAEKKADELNYKGLLIKLNGKELVEQGVSLLLDNKNKAAEEYKDKKEENQKTLWRFYTKKTTVLVYNHTNDEFRFINVDGYYSPETRDTSVGKLVVSSNSSTNNNSVIKTLEFPHNTLVVRVNDNSDVLMRLEEDSDYALTIIKNTIKRAKKALEDQFVKAPLVGSLEEAFRKEHNNWSGYDNALLISLFPQFKSQLYKRLENARLVAIGIANSAHPIEDNDSIIESIKTQYLLSDKTAINTKDYNDAIQEFLDQLQWASLSEEELFELVDFLKKEYLDSGKFFAEAKEAFSYYSYYSSSSVWFGSEYYYLVIKKLVNTVNERSELQTEAVKKALITLGAPLITNDYNSCMTGSLAFLFLGLYAKANQAQLAAIGSESTQAIIQGLDCKNRVFFIEDFFVANLIDSGLVMGHDYYDDSETEEFGNNVIQFLEKENCSFIATKQTKAMIDAFVLINQGLDNSFDKTGLEKKNKTLLFKDECTITSLFKLLAERVVVVENDSHHKEPAFFYEKQ